MFLSNPHEASDSMQMEIGIGYCMSASDYFADLMTRKIGASRMGGVVEGTKN